MDRLFQLNLTNVLNVVTKLNNSPAYYALQYKYHLEVMIYTYKSHLENYNL